MPLGAELPRDVRVVHLGVGLRDVLAPQARPDHEGIHGALDVTLGLDVTHDVTGVHENGTVTLLECMHYTKTGKKT